MSKDKEERRSLSPGEAWLELDLARRMGIDDLLARTRPGTQSPDAAAAGSAEDPELASIAAEVMACQECPLSASRRIAVPGDGNPRARIVFIGEGPGAEEDIQGLPFVGPAGQLLNKMIEAMGLERRSVFITNVVKCRPPSNRTPHLSEIAACRPYLVRQLAVIEPALIITLGRPAINGLLNRDDAMGKLRGQWLEYEKIPVLPTYHPAYLLRSPSQKAIVWQDLKTALRMLRREGP